MSMFLSSSSPFTYVWHENGGQTIAENSRQLSCKVSIDGLTLDIAEDALIAEPIIIINSAAANNRSQNKINIGSNAQVSIIEYMMADDNDSNNNVASNYHCGEGSHLKHCILQHSATNATITQQAIINIMQQTNSIVHSNIFSFGGGTNRVALNLSLDGENAECHASSLAFTNTTEIQDVLLRIDHKQPNCTSTSLARNVLKDKSVTDFIGRIVVHPGAKKTLADLQIKNLICSPKAQATNKPELEIFNDDVRCSHGSSTGQIDELALFYMRSRGIGIKEATEMLIAGFIQPAIDSCSIPEIATFVRSLIEGK